MSVNDLSMEELGRFLEEFVPETSVPTVKAVSRQGTKRTVEKIDAVGATKKTIPSSNQTKSWL